MKIKKPLLGIFIVWFLMACSSTNINNKSMNPNKPHHTKDGFQNYPKVAAMKNKGMMFFLRRIKHSMFLDDAPKNHYISQKQALIDYKNAADTDSITWLGHSAFLIKLDGKVILTDPFISTWASPVPVFGPKRIVPLGIAIEDLPKIDYIVLSHNHYDHLNGIADLPNKETTQVIVPLHNGYLFKNKGFTNIKELDWQESIKIGELEFFAHPAVHNSRRSMFNTNEDLWASWVIKSPNKSIFFSGDTAYSKSIFKNIGKQHKSIDYAFVPIGAYNPRVAMETIHTNPNEAVQIGIDVNAKKLVAMHWGTVNLSDEPMFEPPVLFKEAGQKNNQHTIIMKIGETKKM